MDGEAGWWTTSGNIGLPPLARVMGVGRQQQLLEFVFESVYVDLHCCSMMRILMVWVVLGESGWAAWGRVGEGGVVLCLCVL